MKKKRNLYISLFLLTMTLCFTLAVPASAAKSKKTGWASAYLKIVKELDKEDNARNKNTYFYSPYKYDLIYFDKDKTPELVAGLNGYWVSMYTYDAKNNKACLVIDKWGYGVMGNAGYQYLPKKNVLYNVNSDYAGAIRYLTYQKMQNQKMVSRLKKILSVQYFVDKNKNNAPDQNEYVQNPLYYYGNQKISEKKFKSLQISGKYQSMTGVSSFSQIRQKLISKGAK